MNNKQDGRSKKKPRIASDVFLDSSRLGSVVSKQRQRKSNTTSTDTHKLSIPSSSSSDTHFSPHSVPTPTVSGHSTFGHLYLDSGDCTYTCEHCSASFWYDERVGRSSTSRKIIYNQCCKGGHVRIPSSPEPPDIIKQLYQRSNFLDNIRAYNSMFSMTSFGAHVDESINNGTAPYVFRVEGQICHWIGSLCPPSNEKPRFLQMYIYDTEHEISNRLNFFEGNLRPQFDVEVVSLLISFLEKFNEIVKLFRSARDLCLSSDIPDFSIRLYHSNIQTSYDAPTPGTIGAIVYETVPDANEFDIIIRSKDGPAQRISKLHPLYMALQYPLLFLYGERGWSTELRLASDKTLKEKKLLQTCFTVTSFMIALASTLYC